MEFALGKGVVTQDKTKQDSLGKQTRERASSSEKAKLLLGVEFDSPVNVLISWT